MPEDVYDPACPRWGQPIDVHVQVRAGERPEHRPLLGSLVLSPEQWNELKAILRPVDDTMPVSGTLEITQADG